MTDKTLPRILCLHGGGVNATVFRLQCRTIISQLARSFRLVFLDGPYASPAHADIVPVYGDMGPFYRWLDDESGAEVVMGRCLAAMQHDEGSGAWAGVLGFSQGAKMAVSLLWAQQQQQQTQQEAWTDFKFGVLMAGSAPVVNLDERLARPRHVAEATASSLNFDDWPERPHGEHVVDLPTLHVHGLEDPGLERHRRLRELYCRPDRTRLVEWHGGHRLPIKTSDVQLVVSGIFEMARETGVFPAAA